MTSKQYENIGRAVVLVAQLNKEAESRHKAKVDLEVCLSRLVGHDNANRFVIEQYGQYFPEIHTTRDFLEIIKDLTIKESIKEGVLK